MFDGNVLGAVVVGVQSQLEFSLSSGTTEPGASSSDSKASKSAAGNKVGVPGSPPPSGGGRSALHDPDVSMELKCRAEQTLERLCVLCIVINRLSWACHCGLSLSVCTHFETHSKLKPYCRGNIKLNKNNNIFSIVCRKVKVFFC